MEKIMSAYWFIILVIVAGTVVASVLIFASPVDVRELEADILADKVIDCIVHGGILLDEAKNENFDLVKKCGFNFNDADFEEQQYYVGFAIYEFDSCDEGTGDCSGLINSVEVGRKDFVSVCNEDKKFPQCVHKTIYTLDNSNKELIIKILTGVRKTEKNVKM